MFFFNSQMLIFFNVFSAVAVANDEDKDVDDVVVVVVDDNF